ncbi:MAG: PD-(D/E)XK nuclease family protein, partial [Usitatibacteraceae bacterium]
QVVEKFREALSVLASLEDVQPRMRGDEALNQLRSIVADTVFQPEAEQDEEAPVQVLGILESAGQSFDAIWVSGLSDDAWPFPARPNPLIPAILQRAAGVTEASAATSLGLDQRITDGWRSCAPEVVFSHALTADTASDGGQVRAASALTRDISLTAISSLIEGSAETDYVRALVALRARQAIPDLPFTSLGAPTTVRGGASVLRDQSACPFRAFARHRLGARPLEVPEVGLDAAERGTLLHRVLSLVWTNLASHAILISKDGVALGRLVADAVSKAIAEAGMEGSEGLKGRFAEIEHARLSRLVIDWLNYEKERSPFEVVACEMSREVTLSGLTMRLRLDRLDRLADGTHALIDYKTGVAKVAAWLGERPDEPQLPLYFQTTEEPVSVLAFARVKRGLRGKSFGFEGVSAADDLLPDVAPIEKKFGMEKKGYTSWDVLTAEWERSLGNLVSGFVSGNANVDPKNGNLTCAQCDLHGLCRISELSGSPLSDDDEQAAVVIDE